MPDEPELRGKAREALLSGRIPRQPPAVTYGGPSQGALCQVCEQPIPKGQMEIELVFGPVDNQVIFHLHVRCLAAWELERTK
jgi:hypothetical protein